MTCGLPSTRDSGSSAEDGEADGHLPVGAAGGGVGPGKDGEDDAVVRVLEQPAEPGGGGVQPGVAGEDVLGVRVGPVLADEREDGGQVGGTRRARDHAGP